MKVKVISSGSSTTLTTCSIAGAGVAAAAANMKTKLIALTYRGSASVDPRFSAAMLPWTINDIRSMETYSRLSVGIENGLLEAYNADFELQFYHHLKHVVGMCRIIQKNNRSGYVQVKNPTINYNINNNSNNSGSSNGAKTSSENGGNNFMEFNGPITGMVYLLKDPRDPLLHIYLYECDSIDEMTELMQQIRDPVHTLGGSVGSIPQTLVATSNSGNELSLQKAFRGNGIHSTPASNLKLSEAVRNAQPDPSPNLVSSKMTASKSYTHGLSNSAGTVHIPSSNSATSNLALASDISPNHTHFFEVMYVGKIRVSHKRVPFTFIDDALPKFKAYDSQRARILGLGGVTRSSFSDNGSSDNVSITSKDDHDNDTSDESVKSEAQELKIVEEIDDESNQDDDDNEGGTTVTELPPTTTTNEADVEKPAENKVEQNVLKGKLPKPFLRGHSQIMIPAKKDRTGHLPPSTTPTKLVEIIPRQRDRSASIGCIPLVEQNRTMVFLVGRSDLRLISPDRKQILLHKDFKDVASCAQGHKNADHFGIICREANTEGYIGYVFKCQSDHVADDIVAAISQAFITCSEQKNKERNQIFSCEHCPMLWYHKLCSDIDGLNDKKTQAMIFRRIEQLTDEEQDIIWAKFYGAEKMQNNNLVEQNQFLMMLLRAHCESRQQRHVHDTAENRSEFLHQYLGGSTIFMKAKRSLTNSFDHLLKRKGSKDDIGSTLREMQLQQNKEKEKEKEKEYISEGSNSGGESEHGRSRSNTLVSSPIKPNAEQLKSPMMDIFIKVGNSPKECSTRQGSWRQAILNSVVTPSKQNATESEYLSPMRILQPKKGKRTTDELRELWKTGIRQTILLNRMEKENASLQARQNENELKKVKLDYEEITPCEKQAADRWEGIIEKNTGKIIYNKKDPKVLLQAIRMGVPRSKRGEVWSFLAEQHSMNTAPVDIKKYPNFNTPYNVLLKNLTEHQHAIFIDLGRTFPNHKFYKAPLGIGQLSLFNLLKAYSILDPELGYCQGLGFICGVLLLHCEEEEAFQLLKHLMFRRRMRAKYLPDMKKFQLQLYQLSRLVKDYLPDLYEWLDRNDVSPTLYAAPWILTVFSSQFPLGFVARVFDLLFFESSEVIFKVAIALLTVHKDELLARDNFEDIMDYLKTVVPKIDAKCMGKVMKQVFSMDITKQLTEYQVEYNVLQEEITTSNHHLELLNKEKQQNQHLETQLQFAQSSIAQLEKTRAMHQSQITSLQSQVQTLEVTIQTLGRYVMQVIDRHHDVDIPSDVRRIIQQLDDIEKQRKKPPIFLDRKIGKSVSAAAQLGFPLRVLEELNERENENNSPTKKKITFFDHTYEQLRNQRAQQRPNRLLDHSPQSPSDYVTTSSPVGGTIILSNGDDNNKLPQDSSEKISPSNNNNNNNCIKSPSDLDSGLGTPLSPLEFSSKSPTNFNSKYGHHQQQQKQIKSSQFQELQEITPTGVKSEEMHPLSMCGDVNFRFNGTTQLKSIRSINPRPHIISGGGSDDGSNRPSGIENEPPNKPNGLS